MKGSLYIDSPNNLQSSLLWQSLGLVILLVCTIPADAAMVLDRIIVYFEPKESQLQDITVYNPDPENLYLKTSVFRIIDPGTEHEQRVEPDSTDQIQLLVTPHQAVMLPETRRIFRLYSRSRPQENEAVYRVNFTPETGRIKEGQHGVKIKIAYDVLVFIRPENPHYRIQAGSEGNNIVFVNTGNMNVLIRNGKLCTRMDTKNCSEQSFSHRLYPGMEWSLKVPDNDVAKVGLFDGYSENTQFFDRKKLEPVSRKQHRPDPVAAHHR